MEFIELPLPGLFEIVPRVWPDSRGFFYESFRADLFAEHGITADFVQDNQSYSTAGVLRGLHLQEPPFAQGKLARVIKGLALDVVVDVRVGSPTYGQHAKVLLSGEKGNMIWVPPGFAHAIVTLEDTYFHYKCTNFYNKAAENGLLWNDPELGIDWGIENPVISDKDAILPTLKNYVSPFKY